jgi:hypothetical protein
MLSIPLIIGDFMEVMRHWAVMILALLLGPPLLIQADDSKSHSVQSPPHTVALLELYTSEG